MKFLSFIYEGKNRYGILNNDSTSVIDLKIILNKLNYKIPKDLLEYIQIYSNNLDKEIKKSINQNTYEEIPLENIKILAPIPHPRRNVFCLGKNYADHAKEVDSLPNIDSSIPKHPIYFTKIADPAIGHMDNIIIPTEYTENLDYEVELAIIIGKEGKNISPDNVEEYIFGYTIGNDISARDIQTKHIQWFKGKSLDTTTALGPYIVSKSKIKLPVELDIRCKINGEIRQSSNTRNLIFNIPYIISDLSQGLTLKPGDIILTGTPAGVGAGFKPPKYLKPGDKIESIIEDIGTLINFVK